jgi:hypothetical protein
MTDVARKQSEVLTGTSGAMTARMYELGRAEATPADEWPVDQIIEHLDHNTCRLCQLLHGRKIRRGSPEWIRWHLASHIHCRRILVAIHKDERDNNGNPAEQDLHEPPDKLVEQLGGDLEEARRAWAKLIQQEGHFVTDPKKYEGLRVPARPTGRDFIYSRKAGEKAKLIFARAIPDAALRETLRQIAGTIVADAISSGAGAYAAINARILGQCAQQGATRQWWGHYGADFKHHRDDWGIRQLLSSADFRQLPSAVLGANPDVAVLMYNSLDYGEMPLVVFRARNVQVGRNTIREAWTCWDTERSQLFHAGQLHYDQFVSEGADWTELVGEW